MWGAIGGEQAPASASGIRKAEKEGIWLGKSEGEFVMGSRKVRVWVGQGGSSLTCSLLQEGISRIPCLSSLGLPPENPNCCFFPRADFLYMNYFDSFFD